METERLADVIEFPKVTCESCMNIMYGVYGAFCREFLEDINDLSIANECPGFERDN